MGKRKEKRAQERALLEEFDQAVATERENAPQKRLHCKRCKSEMEGGVCPVCGYKIYTPMAEEKRRKIRAVLTVVCLGVFAVLFFLLVK